MWTYSGNTGSITPATDADNWTLDAVSAGIGKVKEFYWGGEATTSTAMHTKVARSSGGSTLSVEVAGTEFGGQDQPANKLDFITDYGTEPTLNASGTIFAISWNAHGGVVRWLADPDEEIWLVTGQTLNQMSCRNSVGTATSSYGVIWQEVI
tara:strand:- start:5155 stop:5610 length:456 start_codon:yes stop_codon:yes gene_type:complete